MFQFLQTIFVIFTALLALELGILTGRACIFKYDRPERPSKVQRLGTIIKKNFTRKNSTSNPGCLCGEIVPEQSRHLLYIHLKLNSTAERVCPGTIINSNMLLTSHKCLMKTNQVYAFDAWKNSGNLAEPSDIFISTHIMLNDPKNKNFSIYKTKIIYRDMYTIDFKYHGANQALDSDVAIVIVDTNFNNMTSHGPICVPEYNEVPTLKLINRHALYQGVLGYDDLNVKYPTKIYTRFSSITSGKKCKSMGKHNNLEISEDTLCLQFAQPGPTTSGGPLSFTSRRFIDGGPDRAYLAGIATYLPTPLANNAMHKYAYFTNINTIVKYIESVAEKEKSEWCLKPSHMDSHWPWENFKGKLDESLNCECGMVPKSPSGRIIGGENATRYEFPWMVKMNIGNEKYTLPDGNQSYKAQNCGGAIINDRMVLTAAHCFITYGELNRKKHTTPFFDFMTFAKQPEYYYASFRSHMQDFLDDPGSFRVPIKKVIFHPGFPEEKSSGRIDFDIALVILAESLDLRFKTLDSNGNPELVPICLPKRGDLIKVINSGRKATVAGWGGSLPADAHVQTLVRANTTNSSVQPSLQKLDIPVYNVSVCTKREELETDGGMKDGLTDTRLCAGTFSMFKDAWKGDSGGPLFFELDQGSNRYTQIGIVSYNNVYPNATGNSSDASNITLHKAVAVTYYANVETFLDYIGYYSDLYGARGCKQI